MLALNLKMLMNFSLCSKTLADGCSNQTPALTKRGFLTTMNTYEFAHFKVKLIETLKDAGLSDAQIYKVYIQVIDDLKERGCILMGDSSFT